MEQEITKKASEANKIVESHSNKWSKNFSNLSGSENPSNQNKLDD